MTAIGKPPPRKLVVQVRETEKNYVSWIRRSILFHRKRHPNDIGSREVEVPLTYLAVEEKVAAPTQNQAFSALLLLYRNVLNKPLDESIQANRARTPKRLSTVLTGNSPPQIGAAASAA